MILLNSTDSLQVLLSAAVAANQCALYGAYVDMAADGSTFAPGAANALTNSAAAVAWLGAPAAGQVRQVKYLSLYNADTASVTVTVRIYDGTNTRVLLKTTLASGDRLEYTVDGGFRSMAGSAASALVNVQNVISAASITPTFSNDIVRATAQAASLVIANPTGTAVDGWGIVFELKDDGTARALSFGTQYRGIGGALPTTTVAGKRMVFGGIWNAADSKLDVILPVAQET